MLSLKWSARFRNALRPYICIVLTGLCRSRVGLSKQAHGAEIPFVFDNPDKAPNWGLTRNEILQRFADKVSGAWAAFARTGNPNHASLPHWPVDDPGARATMLLNVECHVENDPGESRARGPH